MMLFVYFLMLLSFHGESNDWETSYDFDGDGKNDTVGCFFSGGGGHCCYLVSVHLTSNRKYIKIPFQLDGGYIFGLDLSKPENFFIKDYDGDGLPDLFLHIYHYNGEDDKIPNAVTKKYTVKTNRIAVSFKNGKASYLDVKNEYQR